MSRLGKKLRAHGWEKEFDDNYIRYRKNDMQITYSDSIKDYYRLTSLDETQMVACAQWWWKDKHQLINNRLIVPDRHKFLNFSCVQEIWNMPIESWITIEWKK